MQTEVQTSGETSSITTIRPLCGPEEARACAGWMAASEPWITLKRDLDHSLALLCDRAKEAYVAQVGPELAGMVVVNMHGSFAGYIQAIAVAPGWRSRGVGTQLIQFAEQ